MHNIQFGVYDENVNKKEVEAEWNEVVKRNCWQEGATSLYQPIKWCSTHICEDRDAAEEWIEKHDSGWYDQLAVRFRSYEGLATTKRYDALVARLNDLRNEYYQKNKIPYATTVKSEYIGCKNCGSKLASKYLQRTNRCPLCNSDLRSPTTLSRIKGIENKINETKKLIAEEEKKMHEKQLKKSKVKWLVKVEYHT